MSAPWRSPGGRRGRRTERTGAPRGAQGRRRTVPDIDRSLRLLRRRRRRLGRMGLVLGFAILLATVGFALLDGDDAGDGAGLVLGADEAAALRHPDPAALVPVRVVAVVDGDTLDVRAAGTDLRVRLFGVDTPERGEPCFAEATTRLRTLAGGEVRLLADARQRDPFGRELRYVFTPDGRSLDAALIAEGLGRAWTEDGALRDVLVSLEEETRAAGRGCLWGDAP